MVNHISNSSSQVLPVEQEISKVNHKIDELKVVRDIFKGMKTLDDKEKFAKKKLPIAIITVGALMLTAAVITTVALIAIMCTNPALLVPASVALNIAYNFIGWGPSYVGLSAGFKLAAPAIAAFGISTGVQCLIIPLVVGVMGVSSIIIGGLGLKDILAEEEKGLKKDQIEDYFKTFEKNENWDELKTKKNNELVRKAIDEYQISHNNIDSFHISALIEEFNQKILDNETLRKELVKTQFLSKTKVGQILPDDIQSYIGNFTLSLEAK